MPKTLRQQRHKARILAMQAIFQLDTRESETNHLVELTSFDWVDYLLPEETRTYAKKIITLTLENLTEIDALITARLVNWEFSRISPVSRALLRTGIAQLLYMPLDADAAVIIDEALVITKQYDSNENTSFINGLLDDIHREAHPDAKSRKHKKNLVEKIKIKKRASS